MPLVRTKTDKKPSLESGCSAKKKNNSHILIYWADPLLPNGVNILQSAVNLSGHKLGIRLDYSPGLPESSCRPASLWTVLSQFLYSADPVLHNGTEVLQTFTCLPDFALGFWSRSCSSPLHALQYSLFQFGLSLSRLFHCLFYW
jgi:hypothetical protein